MGFLDNLYPRTRPKADTPLRLRGGCTARRADASDSGSQRISRDSDANRRRKRRSRVNAAVLAGASSGGGGGC
ncbi:hypothetical protein Q5752_002482 [Cryptotrichosporon argae]